MDGQKSTNHTSASLLTSLVYGMVPPKFRSVAIAPLLW